MKKRLMIGMVFIFAILFFSLGCMSGGVTSPTENREPTQPVLHSPSDGEAGLTGNVSLNWLQSNDPDGDSIEYRVYFAREVSRLGNDYETVNNQTGIELNGLESGTWWWRVEAVDSQAGLSDTSEIWHFTVGTSSKPEASAEEDPDLMVESITDESFTLNWPEYSDSEDTDNEVEYEINVVEKDNSAGQRGFNIAFNATTTDTELSVTGLEKGKEYRWVVLAKAENGNQSKIGESECKTGNNPPQPPEIVAPQDGGTVDGTAVTLEWTAPEDADGDEIKYNVYMDIEEDTEKLLMKNTTATTLLVDDLQPGTTYFWRVFAKDCSGGKSVGDTWHFTTAGERTGIPVVEWEEIPDSTINKREFTFEWSAEDSDGEIVLYEYKKEVIEGEKRKHNVWKETENASYTWRNIPPVANRFSVRAIDNDGQYSEIIESTFVCDIAKPELEWTSKPSETIEENSFEFEWQLISESDIKTYKVKKETFGPEHGKKDYSSGWFFIEEDSYEWEEIPEGRNRFSVKAKDTENKYSDPLIVEFTVTEVEEEDEEENVDDLLFIHHSCGQNWLNHSLNNALLEKEYIDERNDITYGVTMTPDNGRPASLGGTPGDRTDMNHWILWFNDYLESVKEKGSEDGRNRIIMFKSCYPNNAVSSEGSTPGDPFSGEKTVENYKAVFTYPDGTTEYERNGYTYKALEEIFAENPDILFIFVTAPPQCWADADPENAKRARDFYTWLKDEWFQQYQEDSEEINNVAIFDWFDVLAYGEDATQHANMLKEKYGGNTGDSHPNALANSESTELFASGEENLLDRYWRTYDE